MLILFLYASLAFVVSLGLVPICRGVARRYGFVASPRADRWHGHPMALLGGVAIATSVLSVHLAVIGARGIPVLFVAAAAIFLIDPRRAIVVAKFICGSIVIGIA